MPCIAAVDEAVAFFRGFVEQQHVGDTAPYRERCVGGICARHGKAAVARGGERRLLGGVRLINVLTQRGFVDIAIERARAHAAIVGVGGKHGVVVEVVVQRQIQKRRFVFGDIGFGIDARVAAGEQTLFLQAVAVQCVVGARQRQFEISRCVAPAEFAEKLPHARRRFVAPAAFLEQIAGNKPVQRLIVAAILELGDAPGVYAERGLHCGTRVAAAIFSLYRQRATQRVQAEQRVGAGHQRDRGNRRFRDEVPAHHIAERLIQAHAVQINRQPLWRAQQGRRGKAAVIHIRLKRIVLHLIDVNAADVAVQKIRQAEAIAALQVGIGGRLHRRRNLLAREADARQRRGTDDFDLG